MSRFLSVSILVFVVTDVVLAGVGCSVPGSSAQLDNDVGSISMNLDVVPGTSLYSASYTITGSGDFSRTGTMDLSRSSILSAVIGSIPAGTGYNIAITATTADGAVTCAGSARFDVTARATSAVTLHLTCHEAPRTGGVAVTGTINICPQIDGVDANPSEVFVGASIQLFGTAHDLDSGPLRLSYTWTATSGDFDNARSQSALFTCSAEGVVSITLTVSDGDPTLGCAAKLAVNIVCTDPTTAAKQSEAKANLKSLFTAEKAFFQAKDRFSTSPAEIGFAPERNNRYRYVLTANPQSLEDRSGVDVVDHVTDEGISEETFMHPPIAATISLGPCVGELVWGISNNGQTFTGAAYADLDGDGTLDVWTISTDSRTLSGAGCDSAGNVASGEPANEINDVIH